jgi:lipopolysaccharide biosynthesis glycosyltransferase
MNTFPVFFSFDEAYVTPAAVTFESLLSSARPGASYELYVLHEGISIDSQQRLTALVGRHGNGRLTFISVAGVLESAGIVFDNRSFCLGHDQSAFTKETLLRCLPALVPEFNQYDRILYSDVDICVVDDISDIFSTDLDGLYMAGCRIPAFLADQTSHFPSELRERYVAGGIWLMNLRQLRLDGMGEKILGLMRNPPFRLIWNDQDVMNLACAGKVAFLSYRYCSIPMWRSVLEKVDYVDARYPDDELREAMFRPKIVHYASSKPWKGGCEGGDLWHFWRRRSGFPPIGPEGERGPNVKAYFMKFIPLPRSFVRCVVRGGDMTVKICGIILRLKLRRMSGDR